MNAKLITTAVLSALLAFLIGNNLRVAPSDAASVPTTGSPEQAKLIASLRQDNESLKAEAARLKVDLERVDAANTE